MLLYYKLTRPAQIGIEQFSRVIPIASAPAAKLRPTFSPLNALVPFASSTLAPSVNNKNSPRLPRSYTNIASRRTDQIFRHLSSISSSLALSSATMSQSRQSSEFSVRKIGAPNTLDFRAFIEKDGMPISPFHDVPLYANEQQTILNMVVEIPRWTNAKLEVWLATKMEESEVGGRRLMTDDNLSTRSPKKNS
jgi:hypothetical protein